MFDSEKWKRHWNRENIFKKIGEWMVVLAIFIVWNAIAFWLDHKVFLQKLEIEGPIYFMCGMACMDVLRYVTKKRKE